MRLSRVQWDLGDSLLERGLGLNLVGTKCESSRLGLSQVLKSWIKENNAWTHHSFDQIQVISICIYTHRPKRICGISVLWLAVKIPAFRTRFYQIFEHQSPNCHHTWKLKILQLLMNYLSQTLANLCGRTSGQHLVSLLQAKLYRYDIWGMIRR